MFSMRQIQELLVTVSLSWMSLTLLLVALILGSSSIWRDIERRWLFSTFGLPIERSTYLFSKVTTIFISLLVAGLFFGWDWCRSCCDCWF
jgi:ABC-type transport system involved in multi-copper enzyme maturation permease subunit